MRWIFITLAVINLAVFAWGMVVGSQEQGPLQTKKLKNPYGQYPEIVLLSELSATERDLRQVVLEPVDVDFTLEDRSLKGGVVSLSVVDSSLEGTLVDEGLIASGEGESTQDLSDGVERFDEPIVGSPLPMHENKLLCELVGPFESREVARDFIARLEAIEVVSSERDIELPAGPGYWVYLQPKASRREALRMLGELQSKRIDSYVIPKGDLVNGISLGMFSKKTLSEARVKEMRAIGLDPKVEEIERTYREVWVMLNPGEDSKMSKLTWERTTQGIKDLQRRQNYCLEVASEQNIQ